MPPRCHVREVSKVLQRAWFEKKYPIYDDGRKIVEEGHLSLIAESRCPWRKLLTPFGMERKWSSKMGDLSLMRLALFMCPSQSLRSRTQSRPRLCWSKLLETREISQWRTALRLPWKGNMQPEWPKGREWKKLSVNPRSTWSRGRHRLKK